MKMKRRLTALLLCAVLLLSLAGCEPDPVDSSMPSTVPTTPPTAAPTEPTEPQAVSAYDQARKALDALQNITLDLTVTTYTTVNDDEFSEQSNQTLTYQGLGTDEFAADMDSTLYYSVHSENVTQEELEEAAVSYQEIFIGGDLYIRCLEQYCFTSTADAADIAMRYAPAVLLDAALYGSITFNEDSNGTEILFSQPTAAEAWAMPEDAVLSDAFGSATLDADGAITQMDYTVTYTYGPAEVRLEVQSKPRKEAQEVTAPKHADKYHTVEAAQALPMFLRARLMLSQADSITANSTESLFSAAAGCMRNQSTQLDLHGRQKDTQSKIDYSMYFMDYSTNESVKQSQEELYLDGRYTITTNDGLPSTQPGITWEQVREYCVLLMNANLITPDFWKDVTITDMGSVYLLEFEFNEDFGNNTQNNICNMLWGDPSFLVNMSSKYETTKSTGYLSIDKYTGLSMAGGYYYEGVHTIEGTDYILSLQTDQALNAPSTGAYKEITGEMPAEEEPENKATPLFYHVTGKDGQELWLLGTIHIGDERTAYLPQEIRDAFENSDALALECDSDAFMEQLEKDEALQEQVSALYYLNDGVTLESLMSAEEYALALKVSKATGNYSMNMPYFTPYCLSSSIENFYLQQGQTLHADQGVENRLTAWAKELGKPIREVESSLFQIQMSANFSTDLQLLMLQSALTGDAREYWEGANELYELWCAGDEEALRKEVSTQVDTSDMTEEELAEFNATKHLMDEYNKAVSYDRNEGMLKVAKQYLESGDTVFYAVGLAHLLDDVNGLVDALRAAGYTVELVEYK